MNTYKFSDVNGVRMHYDVQGEGPTLVLIHAGIAHLGMWDEQVDAFKAHFKVIRHDVRGFGQTPDPAGKYTDYEDLKTLLNKLGVEKAHILGISNGGRIALDFAVTYPELVDKLVLVAPGLPGYTGPPDPVDEELSAASWAAIQAGKNERATEIETQLWVDGPRRKPEDLDPDFRQRAIDFIRYTIDLGIGDGEGDIARPPAGERLDTITAPTLLMVGEYDLDGMHGRIEQLEAGLPNARRVDMAGTAHLPPMEKPDEFNRIVLDFLLE